MSGEMRIECKYCNTPVYAPVSQAGKKTKCPNCKQIFVIPNARVASEQKPVKKKNTSKRPVHARPKLRLGDLVKFALLIVLAYGGYRGYQYYKELTKPLATLLKEYEGGRTTHEALIMIKITRGEVDKKDIATFESYSISENNDTRVLVASCLGKIGDKKTYDTLARMLEKDKEVSVRKVAATALGSIETNQCVAFLLKRMELEKNEVVKGEIVSSLRSITGNRDTTRVEAWKMWWKENKNKKFADDK